LLTGSIRLDPGTTKNDQGREVVMTQFVRKLLTECIYGKQADDRVFTRADGTPVVDFCKTWANVCCAAGVGKLICVKCEHDLAEAARKLEINQQRELEAASLREKSRAPEFGQKCTKTGGNPEFSPSFSLLTN
jgi:hypothetical protein